MNQDAIYPEVKLIYARGENFVIGRGNQLPWNCPADLKIFKEKTDGQTVLMGRSTWVGLPEKYRPLPNRHNVVITSMGDAVAAVVPSPDEVVKAEDIDQWLQDQAAAGSRTIWVIGGRQTYDLLLPYAREVHETVVRFSPEGDVSIFEIAANKEFNRTVGYGATDSWTFCDKSRLMFRINVYMRTSKVPKIG